MVLEELIKRPIIPVIEITDADDAQPLAEALLAGGLDVIEITFRTAAASETISRIKQAFPQMLLGAGTVLSHQQANIALDLGVDFGLAPGLNSEIVQTFRKHNTCFIPGVATPTEIEKALALGCRMLKFFPAEALGGVPLLKALYGPYASQGVLFCPTGGVNLQNLRHYLELDWVKCVGGSWLATKRLITDRQWSTITEQVRQALALAKELMR